VGGMDGRSTPRMAVSRSAFGDYSVAVSWRRRIGPFDQSGPGEDCEGNITVVTAVTRCPRLNGEYREGAACDNHRRKQIRVGERPAPLMGAAWSTLARVHLLEERRGFIATP